MDEIEMTTQQKVIALVREKGSVVVKDVVEMGLTRTHAGVILMRLARRQKLKREGIPRKYTYSLP